jgi:hypothetical protein
MRPRRAIRLLPRPCPEAMFEFVNGQTNCSYRAETKILQRDCASAHSSPLEGAEKILEISGS